MLKCKGCNNFFIRNLVAYTYDSCNHTLCIDCFAHTCGGSSRHCCICCKENTLKENLEDKEYKINPLIKELKDDIEEAPYLAAENLIVDYQIQEINTLCTIHKYPSVSYSIKKSKFVCELCKDDDKYSLTIKQIIDIKYQLVYKKMVYLYKLKTIKAELKQNNNKHNEINVLIMNRTLSDNIKKELMKLLSNRTDTFINKVYSIVDDIVGKHNYKVKKLYDIYKDFIKQYKELKLEIEKNKTICKDIRKHNYSLNENYKIIIYFRPPVCPENILSLKEKYTKVVMKLDYGIKEMLKNCISRIQKLKQAKNYHENIESIFEKIYDTMLGNQSENNE